MKKTCAAFLLLILSSIFALAQEPDAKPPVAPDHFKTSNQALIEIVNAADAAWLSGDFDRAIQLCDQGIALAPKEPGFWANKASALMQRARIRYYKGTHSDDEAVKKEMIEAARSDIREALSASVKTVDLVRGATEPTDPALLDAYQFKQVMSLRLKAQVSYLMTRLVDESYAANAVNAIDEYVAIETDAHEKSLAQLHSGEMLIQVRKFREAFAVYQKILLDDPASVDANLGAAVSLINLGFAANEKTSSDQGLEYLGRFVAAAPASHPLKGSAEQALQYLKAEKPPFVYTPPRRDPPSSSPIVGGVMNGKAVNLPFPPYPAIARFARVQGSVPVRVLIDEDGRVLQARVESGHPLLQAPAVAAALTARFSPTMLSGRPVKVIGIIVYNFVAQ